MHVPFRQWSDLEDPLVNEKVPARWRFFAHALQVAGDFAKNPNPSLSDFWRRDDRIKTYLEKEGNGEGYIKDVIHRTQ
eukprot:1300360-Karenia_brevis.AAC.1